MAEDFDIGPLTWVKDEIEQALAAVLDNLESYAANPADSAVLRFSQTHLYQVSGALDMVGLQGCKRFCAEIEKIEGRLEKGSLEFSPAVIEAVRDAVHQLQAYLNDLLAGAPDVSLRLFPTLSRLAEIQGESVSESELFFPDTEIRAPKNVLGESLEIDNIPAYVAEQRMAFQKALLSCLKTGKPDSLNAMRAALDNIQKIQQQPAQRTLWWVAGGFVDALSEPLVAQDMTVKRLCRQLDQQLRSLGSATNKSSGNLMRDLLFQIAKSTVVSERILSVRDHFELQSLLPQAEGVEMSALAEADLEHIQHIADIIPDIKSLWSRIAEAGPAKAQELLPEFNARLSDMANLAGQLSSQKFSDLLQVIHKLASRMGHDVNAITESSLVEVAASLNTLGDLLDSKALLEPHALHSLEAHEQRLLDLLEGLQSDGAAAGKLDRGVLLAVGQQIKDALQEVEGLLDTYFRNPEQRDVLMQASKPLGQVVAAFDMLEMPTPSEIASMAGQLVALFQRTNNQQVNQEDFEVLAESLSMLGFFVDEFPRIRPETTGALETALTRLKQHGSEQSVAHATAGKEGKTSEKQEPSRDLDPELLDIFITEAEEVLGNIAQNMQELRVNATSHDALVEVRRGYHTLKGSARTVGLADLGEVAWIVERMLNTVMENKQAPTTTQLNFIDKVSGALATRVAELKDAGPGYIERSIDEWIEEADALEQQTEKKPAKVVEEVLIGGTRKMSKALFNIFTNEARQHLETMKAEAAKVTLDTTGKPAQALIRSAHTLASNAGATGFNAISELSRALENWLDVHPETWDAKQVTLLNNVVAKLDEMLEKVLEKAQPKRATGLLNALKKAKAAAETAPKEVAEQVPLAPVVPIVAPTTEPVGDAPVEKSITGEAGFIVTTLVDQDLLSIFMEEARELVPQIGRALRAWRKTPSDVEPADALQRDLHTLKGSARMAGQTVMGDTVHAMEDRIMQALKKKVSENDFDDLFEGLDRISALLEEITGDASVGRSTARDRKAPVRSENRRAQFMRMRADVLDRLINEAGEISIARSRMEREMEAFKHFSLDLTESVFRLRNYLRELEIETESQMQSRLTLLQETQETFDPLEFDRFTRLQELTRMMAESVNDVSTIQHGLLMNLDETESALQQQNRMNRELQYGLMAVRMVPFSQISERLHRIVRQTARELSKSVELLIEGGDVQIDRSVLDKIGAPLEHLLRNAVGHGMESATVRKKAGKPETGTIRLKVLRENEEIVLTVEDDGAGINLEKVRSKAIENGLITADQETSEQSLLSVIFEPGFSTATDITQISGRGVGLDAVRGDITGLGGRIEVVNAPMHGAVFSIYLPVTLSVTQVVLIRAGGHIYALPSIMVEQLQKLKPAALASAYSGGAVTWSERMYPIHFFAKLIGDVGLEAEPQAYSPILLLRSGPSRIALHVDEIIGNQEVVIKPIGPQLARVPGITGATVMGDGKIILIVNPIQLANREVIAVTQIKAPVLETTESERLTTVMVVDDSLTMRKVLGRTLEREGYQVITAKDGMDALQILQETKPDIMLLDIEMPRMDGFELTRNIRGDASTAAIPIIMISSRTAEKHQNHAKELGVNAFLGKPVQDDELLMEIQVQLSGAPASV